MLRSQTVFLLCDNQASLYKLGLPALLLYLKAIYRFIINLYIYTKCPPLITNLRSVLSSIVECSIAQTRYTKAHANRLVHTIAKNKLLTSNQSNTAPYCKKIRLQWLSVGILLSKNCALWLLAKTYNSEFVCFIHAPMSGIMITNWLNRFCQQLTRLIKYLVQIFDRQ